MFKQAIQTDSNISSMRMGFMGCLIVSWIVAILGLLLGRDPLGIAGIISALLVPAMGAKAYQARGENK